MKKKQIINIRTTILDKKILKKRSSDSGKSMSEFILQAALGKEMKYKLTADELECYKGLHKYARHFQNIKNMYHGRNPEINEEVRLVIDLIKEHLQKFES